MTSCSIVAALAGCVGLADHCAAGNINIGGASDYALLFEGFGGNTMQITNTTVGGNIGLGHTAQANLGGPGTISGRMDFANGNSSQLSGSNVTVAGGVFYNVGAVASALDTVNTLNTTLGAVTAGPNIAIGNASTTLDISTGFLASGAGFSNVRFFDVSSYSMGNNSTLTIQGDGSGDAVVLNFTNSTNFSGQVNLTGGLTPDQVIFNFVGGSGGINGPTLQINNQGDGAHPDHNVQGIFLDPNGAISVVAARIRGGRVFGGDTHDFQYVSGSEIIAPITAVPLPHAAAMAFVGIGAITARRRRTV
jgi:hypothetical protein